MSNVKTVLIGSVNSTRRMLEKLVEHHLTPALVLGYEPASTLNLSGFASLREDCALCSIPFEPFLAINDHVEMIQATKPDVIFVVGLSQLVSDEIINSASIGAVGFHPTRLPKGRGRAAIPWMILTNTPGAATFFVLESEADAGPILAQSPFPVLPADTAQTVESRVLDAMSDALDDWLPSLARFEWNPRPQDELVASSLGIRRPPDGVIEWSDSADNIDRLVRATTRPYPGAYTFLRDERVRVFKTRIDKGQPIIGVTGRVLQMAGQEAMVQTGNGHLWLIDYEIEGDGSKLRVGQKLGYNLEYEIYRLRRLVNQLEDRIGECPK